MMGAGKTTTGRMLADRLGWRYLDTDDEVERRCGRTIPELWKAEGEPAFRSLESLVLAEACRDDSTVVVSVAGGAVVSPDNRDVLRRSGTVIWLRADVKTLAGRVGRGSGRPLLAAGPEAALARLSDERSSIYADLSDLVFDVDTLSPPQVVDRIIEAMKAHSDA